MEETENFAKDCHFMRNMPDCQFLEYAYIEAREPKSITHKQPNQS